MVTQNEYMEIINNGPPLNRDYRHGYGIILWLHWNTTHFQLQ
jgi:hypothetical protein